MCHFRLVFGESLLDKLEERHSGERKEENRNDDCLPVDSIIIARGRLLRPYGEFHWGELDRAIFFRSEIRLW